MNAYVVIGVTNASRRGIDYTSPFFETWQEALAAVEKAMRIYGHEAQFMVIKYPFTNDALTTTLSAHHFESPTC